jgi:hypothetical protein
MKKRRLRKPTPLMFKSLILAEIIGEGRLFEGVVIPNENRVHADPKQLRRLSAWLDRAADYLEQEEKHYD